MKFIPLLLITLLFTTFLNADYLRTIRLGAFESKSQANYELKKLKKFVKKHQNILDYQKEWDFTFKYRKSGGYYVTLAEPMRDRAVLQEVIDTLRLSYPDAYVTKLKSAPAFTYKKIEEIEEKTIEVVEVISEEESVVIPEEVLAVNAIPETLFQTEEITPDISSVTVEEAIEIPQVLELNQTQEEITQLEVEVQPEVEKIDEVLETPKVTKAEPLAYNFDEKEVAIVPLDTMDTKSTDIYPILFYITLFLLLVVSALLYKYKVRSIFCKDKAIEIDEIFTKKDIEIRHKDSFLTHAKTSVATIHNFTNLLLEFDLTVIQKDYVQRIRSSSEHLLNTVNNTLDMTKLKDETLRIENSEFDLNEMLRKVSKIISLEAKNNDTEFELNVEDNVPAFIFGDPTRIRQVLINLLGNSVKFTENGKISLTIKTLYNYTNAITLGFNIKDTGIGMTTEQVDDIHESSTEIIEGGTVGLGLSVTKQLIQMMNGEIKIYSTQDVGTTFTFTLKFSVTR